MSEQTEEIKEIKTSQDGVIFVQSTTNTKGLATCIFACATKEKRKSVKIRGIGAGAVNQMAKAYIIAKGRLGEKGINSKIDMSFKDVEFKDQVDKTISAIEFQIDFIF